MTLMFDDAYSIVHSSIQTAIGTADFSAFHRLLDVGIDDDVAVSALVRMISAVGAKSISAAVDLPRIATTITVGRLVETVQLSGRKLCVRGHAQPCCPYPDRCPECPRP